MAAKLTLTPLLLLSFNQTGFADMEEELETAMQGSTTHNTREENS